METVDLAELLRMLSEEEQMLLLQVLAVPLAATTLTELASAILLPLLEQIDDHVLCRFIEQMDPDDATDILRELPDERRIALLTMMETETVDAVDRSFPTRKIPGEES